MSEFAVKGLKETLDMLAQLGPRIERQAIRSGLTAAAGVVRDEARLRVPRVTGLTAGSIRSGSPRKNQDGTFSITVSARGNRHAFVAYFIEYGVRPHLITARGAKGVELGGKTVSARTANKAMRGEGIASDVADRSLKIGDRFVGPVVSHPGFAARPFLRPALENRAQEAIEAFRVKIVAVVEKKTGFNITEALAA